MAACGSDPRRKSVRVDMFAAEDFARGIYSDLDFLGLAAALTLASRF